MKTKQTKEEEDYILDIYDAKVEVAIAAWESGEYPKRKEREKQ